MDVGADAAGQVISLAGQIFKIGMEGMVVVVRIAGKGAVHAAALLAAALSGKKKTKGKVLLRNMLKDSKGITLFTIKQEDLAKFSKEAKAYNVRFCIVKDKYLNDGNIDMFIRAEDAAVVNRIIERYGLTAVRQDVSVENAEGQEEAYGGETYVYGDVTISRELNSLVEDETETQIKTRVPGTYGKNVRYVYFDKAGLEEVHGGKSYKVHIEPEGSYELYDEGGSVAETVSGEELLKHYDRKDNEVELGNSKARTASGNQSGKNYQEGSEKAEKPGKPEAEEKQAGAEQPGFVYGDITISHEKNSLVEDETEKQIKTRVPGTFGKDVRYVFFDKSGLEEVHGGRSYKVHIGPGESYKLYDAEGSVAETVSGKELLKHYDSKDKEAEAAPENSKARTAPAGESYSGPDNETKAIYVAYESYYEHNGGREEDLYDERCRLLSIDENGEIGAYSGHEGFFRNEDELNAYLEQNKELRYVSKESLEDIAAGRYPENKGQEAEQQEEKLTERNDKASTSKKPAVSPDRQKQPSFVYGDITISHEKNSLVEDETEKQIKTRVPGTFGKDVRYVFFDKAGLEEVHGGRSYKVHIEPEGRYELYDAEGTVTETVSGEELLKNYDSKDKQAGAAPENSKARTAPDAPDGESRQKGKGTTAGGQAAREASAKSSVPNTRNKFNKFSQRSYDFDALERELLSNNKPSEPSEGRSEEENGSTVKAQTGTLEAGSAGQEKQMRGNETVSTNIGTMPIEDYREIAARQYGFDSYDDLYASGARLGGGYDKGPEPVQEALNAETAPDAEKYDVLAVNDKGEILAYSKNEGALYNEDRNGMELLSNTRLSRAEPRSEAEMRPSVKEKLSGYKNKEQEDALERQIKAAEEKRERETRQLEREGGDVLPKQREKMDDYTKSRDAAMAEFLSDAKDRR